MRLNVLYSFKNASALVGYTGFFTSEISQDTRTGGKGKRRRKYVYSVLGCCNWNCEVESIYSKETLEVRKFTAELKKIRNHPKRKRRRESNAYFLFVERNKNSRLRLSFPGKSKEYFTILIPISIRKVINAALTSIFIISIENNNRVSCHEIFNWC